MGSSEHEDGGNFQLTWTGVKIQKLDLGKKGKINTVYTFVNRNGFCGLWFVNEKQIPSPAKETGFDVLRFSQAKLIL